MSKNKEKIAFIKDVFFSTNRGMAKAFFGIAITKM